MWVYSFQERRASGDLEKAIKEYGRHDFRIIPVDRVGRPEEMRALMCFKPKDWVVCAYMGGSETDEFPEIGALAHDYAYELAFLNKHVSTLRMPPLNGGGLERRIPFKTGMMGEWNLGVFRAGFPVNCVITEDLIPKEGLFKTFGQAICLISYGEDKRLGVRTNGLATISDAIIVFPGGIGTLAELLDRLVLTSASGRQNGKRAVIINPVVMDDETGQPIRYFDYQLKQLKLCNKYGQLTNTAIENLNNQVVLYNPREGATAHEMKEDLHSIIFATRFIEETAGYNKGLQPLPPEVMTHYCRQLNPGNKIEMPFGGRNANGNWFYELQSTLATRPVKVQRIHMPGGLSPA